MITVLIPCLNEEITIERTLQELYSVIGKESQVIVIDNGSEDNTALVAKQNGAEVYFEPMIGKGFAFRAGLNYVKPTSKVIVLIDGDSTYSLTNLRSDIELILFKGFDMVVGNRVPDKFSSIQFRKGHKFGNQLLTRCFRSLFDCEICDTLSGYRVMSRGFALSFTQGASQFELETELNVHAFHLKAPVINVDIEYRARPQGSNSKLKTYGDGVRILVRLLALWRTERPLSAYLMTSLPLAIFALALFSRAVVPFINTGKVPNLPSLVAAVGLLLAAMICAIAGIILDRTNLIRSSFSRYLYRQESRIK
jgi:glycosyltransferase involved in cell wall biosynthesis